MASNYIYEETIYNKYLGKSKLIKAANKNELKNKKHDQLNKWEKEEEREKKRLGIEEKINKAVRDTQEAKAMIDRYKNILNNGIDKDIRLNFDKYLRKTKFKEFNYIRKEHLLEDIYQEEGVPNKSWLEFFFSRLAKKRTDAENEAKEIWKERTNKSDEKYTKLFKKYNLDKIQYEKEQKKFNNDIKKWKVDFEFGKKYAIKMYAEEILNKSEYPNNIAKDFQLEYNDQEKRIIVLYKMPNPQNIPNIIEYKYIKIRNEVDIKNMSKVEFDKFYDDIIYQITLRSIYEIFFCIDNDYLTEVVFNGWVDYIDKATGKDTSSCIISIMVNRDDFVNIDLERINYRECIKGLKGIFVGKLISLIPIRPIMNLSTEDKRFIENKNILEETNNGTNLASMNWDDFEQLVRELFEHKFSGDGTEVKITQASRDGGVDAVAFDPDPLKGGKFIIQAKRYNNIVPVSATRDLFGTVMHEHAIRGILVTTSNYGNDSYEFAKDKPLTLINGNELLGMFNDLGYSNLRIDLWENKRN